MIPWGVRGAFGMGTTRMARELVGGRTFALRKARVASFMGDALSLRGRELLAALRNLGRRTWSVVIQGLVARLVRPIQVSSQTARSWTQTGFPILTPFCRVSLTVPVCPSLCAVSLRQPGYEQLQTTMRQCDNAVGRARA